MPGCRHASPAGARAQAVELEELIEVDEWCAQRGLAHPFGLPAAMTRSLCDAIERIPFRQIGKTSAAQRAAELFRRAVAAHERGGGRGASAARPDCSTVAFCAPLPCSAADPAWIWLKLHCGPGDDGGAVLTLGMEHEL